MAADQEIHAPPAEAPSEEDALARTIALWKLLGDAGLVVSVAYGPCGGSQAMFTVDVLVPAKRETFRTPLAALDFPQAVQIAYDEALRRRWLRKPS